MFRPIGSVWSLDDPLGNGAFTVRVVGHREHRDDNIVKVVTSSYASIKVGMELCLFLGKDTRYRPINLFSENDIRVL